MTMTRKPTDINDVLKRILRDGKFRQEITTNSIFWFFYCYFSHYVECPIAPFHKDMFKIIEDINIPIALIEAFRDSAKSSIVSMASPLWQIMGKNKIKFILLISQTQFKAQKMLQNIKHELEDNKLLKKDLGPFQEETNEWNINSLYLPKYDAKITALSVGQSVRGLRHKQFRPQIVICDDIEDLASVKTQEGRDKTYSWLTGEVLPVGDKGTRFFFLGNALHNDSACKRLQKHIESGAMNGVYRRYPFMDEQGRPLWPGKFPDQTAINAEKNKFPDQIAWLRENMLQIIDEDYQIIQRGWIQYYDTLPPNDSENYRYAATGVDPAISQKETADYTAMVSAKIYGYGKKRKILILPNPLNKRLAPSEIPAEAKIISLGLGGGVPTRIFVEDVAFQGILVDLLKQENLPVESMKPYGRDKKSRLMAIAFLIESGQILFPRTGAEKLIEQIIGYGVEKHDDLLDALTTLILKILELESSSGYGWIEYAEEELKRLGNMSEDEKNIERIKRQFGMS